MNPLFTSVDDLNLLARSNAINDDRVSLSITGVPFAPEMEEELIRDIPLRRLGQTSDIADMIVLLASDQARWITVQLPCVHWGTGCLWSA